jgi:membrane-associated HD superfamily phosphohydrolase
MIKKYSVLIGVVFSLILIMIAISIYPGGTMFDEYSIGFDWTKNFMSNLFGTKALNGAENPSRIWAFSGMILLPFTYAVFFINMAKKIPDKNAANILKYGGVANILFTFLTVTRLHDIMLIISTTLFWTCLFIITVFILKTRLHLFKFFCIISLLVFYYGVYLWGTSEWSLLPIMQKVNFVSSTLLILGLEYFTKPEDFAHIKSRTHKKLATNQ